MIIRSGNAKFNSHYFLRIPDICVLFNKYNILKTSNELVFIINSCEIVGSMMFDI
jgi:hypothetical protein